MPKTSPLARPRAALTKAHLAVGALLVSTISFLTIGPILERRHAIQTLAMGSSDTRALHQAMHLSCKNEEGRLALNLALARQPLADRLRVAQLALELGCTDALAPALRAELDLYSPDSRGALVSQIIAQQRDAVEPCIQALNAPQPVTRQRARRALTGLADLLNEDQRQRALARQAQAPSPSAGRQADALRVEVAALRLALGQAPDSPRSPKPPAPRRADAPAPQASPDPAPDPAPDPDPVLEPLRLSPPVMGQSLERPAGGVLFRLEPDQP